MFELKKNKKLFSQVKCWTFQSTFWEFILKKKISNVKKKDFSVRMVSNNIVYNNKQSATL